MNKDYVRLTIGMRSSFKKLLRKCAASVDMDMSAYILMLLEHALRGVFAHEETVRHSTDKDVINETKEVKDYLRDKNSAKK